jgi:G:T-mismatch repair DNA endonuclease (very short patch repair protein)
MVVRHIPRNIQHNTIRNRRNPPKKTSQLFYIIQIVHEIQTFKNIYLFKALQALKNWAHARRATNINV